MRFFSVACVVAAMSLNACAPDVVSATPDAAADQAAPLDVAASDVAAPDVAAPDVAAPDVAAPEVAASDVAASDVAAPDVAAPDAPDPVDVTDPVDAPAPPGRDLSVLGPNRIAIWTGPIAGTNGNARVFYPMTAGDARYPLVTFTHGFQLAVNNYDRLLAHVASWGYVVASVSYPGTILSTDHRNVAAAQSAARRAFMGGGPAGFPAGARVDAARAIAMGHSLGGKGAIMALLDDSAFIAGLALDPVDDNPSPLGRITDATPSVAPERMSGLRRPLGLFGATQSRCGFMACAPTANNYQQFASAAPAGSTVVTWPLNNFGHMDFVDPGCGFACNTCSGGAAPIDTRIAALRELTVSFLERFARGDTSVQGALDGARRAELLRAGALWDGATAPLPACR
jgi:hypothetical protein